MKLKTSLRNALYLLTLSITYSTEPLPDVRTHDSAAIRFDTYSNQLQGQMRKLRRDRKNLAILALHQRRNAS